MKKLYLFGNLKMNLNKDVLGQYLSEMSTIANQTNNVVGVALPFVYLPLGQEIVVNSKLMFGSQNVNQNEKGAFTGEVSFEMLKDFDTSFVLIGHSERRQYYNETNESVNKKLLKALEHDITPIVCVGETLDQKQQGKTYEVVLEQLTHALENVNVKDIEKVIVAYEPVWAIGTGLTATNEEINLVCTFIKTTVKDKLKFEKDVVVLYGGSLNTKNASEILKVSSVDGGLIGGASLKVEDFKQIILTKIDL